MKRKLKIFIILLLLLFLLFCIFLFFNARNDSTNKNIKSQKLEEPIATIVEDLSEFTISDLNIEKYFKSCYITFNINRDSFISFNYNNSEILLIDKDNNLIFKVPGSFIGNGGFIGSENNFTFSYETEYDISKTVKVVLSSDKYPYKYNEDLTKQIKKVYND